MQQRQNLLERVFERALWSSRLVMLVAVSASVLLAFGAFYFSLIDLAYFFSLLIDYASLDPQARGEARNEAITAVVKVTDGFLIGAILLLIAFGLYELFVSRISPAERSETGPRLLDIRSLEDLKERVAKLVLLVLTVEFFQRALRIPYESALDLLYLGAAILLVSGALFLIGRRAPDETMKAPPRQDRQT